MTRHDIKISALLFASFSLLWLFPGLLPEKTFFAGDLFYSFHPWLSFSSQGVHAGRLNFWDPYTSCGIPFVANMQVMAFSPTSILFKIWGFTPGLKLFLILHFFLAGWGTYLLSRRWRISRFGSTLAGLSFAFGGLAWTHLEFLSALSGLSYLPWILLCLPSVSIIPLTAALALLFFSGYPQFSLYGLLACITIGLTSQAKNFSFWTRLICASILSFAIFSLQFWPSWEAAAQSQRASLSLSGARSSLIPFGLFTKLFVPDLLGKSFHPFFINPFRDWPLTGLKDYWWSTLYIGTGTLLLAFLGLFRKSRYTWGAAGLGLLGILIATDTPFFQLLWKTVPGASYLTHYANASVLIVLGTSLLAGIGWDHIQTTKKHSRIFLSTLGIVVIAAVLLHLLIRSAPPLNPEQINWMTRACVKSGILLALFSGLFLIHQRKPFSFLKPSILILAMLDLFIFTRGFHPTQKPSLLTEENSFASVVGPLPGYQRGNRIYIAPDLARMRPMAGNTPEEGYRSLRQILLPNIHLPYRVRSVHGYESISLQRFTDFRKLLEKKPFQNRLIDFTAGRTYLDLTLPKPGSYRNAGNAIIYLNESSLPRATLPKKERVIRHRTQRLEYMRTSWNPSEEVILEEPPIDKAKAGTVSVTRNEPSFIAKEKISDVRTERFDWKEENNRILLNVRTTTPGWLVLSDTHYPGWEAYALSSKINGSRGKEKELKIYRANHAFRALRAGPGWHHIWMLYRPKSFSSGLALTMGSVIFLLIILVWTFKKIARPELAGSPSEKIL